MSRFDRADRALGCILWKPLTFLLVVATAGCVWAALAILRETSSPDRWLGFLLAMVGALVFGAGAFGAARKKRITEIDP
jgi:drug/metabolite transporter (DMT)-like permease